MLSYTESDDDVEYNKQPIRWVKIIFLPFSRWWQFIIVCTAFLKCLLCPMKAIYSSISTGCGTEEQGLIGYILIYYRYIGDPVYVCDTFLYIIHRQVKDEAMKREYVPKSVKRLLLDITSLLPIFSLLSTDVCARNPTIWPHILNFNELFVIYRIADYCKLKTTHSYWQIILGYTFTFIIISNAMVCGFVLATRHGLCKMCQEGTYDWRSFTYSKFENKNDYVGHWYVWIMLTSRILRYALDTRIPNTVSEFLIECIIIVGGYLFIIILIMPKFFSENIMRLKLQYKFNPRVLRILEETKIRNPSTDAHVMLENYYTYIWTKKNGLCSMPRFVLNLPWYLRIHINYDLVYPVFLHSPILRNTSTSFKRWLCEHVDLVYKMPGERFFIGSSCYSKLYYVKSGIVQLIAADDSAVPMLSVTSGTLFGDVSFLIPPINRKVIMRCFSYCEVLSIPRSKILMSLHKFPKDRIYIMKLAKERLQHARDLHNIKLLENMDRVEREDIAWIKHRWWEISNTIESWKLNPARKYCAIPVDEINYHCAKYIGQLVLCPDAFVRRKSMFYKETFPWILAPHSIFGYTWYLVVKTTATVALFLMPPNLTRNVIKNVPWFTAFSLMVNLLYSFDVIVLLFTSTSDLEKKESIVQVIMQRFKKKHFILDLLALPWVETFLYIFDLNEYQYLASYNRLLKTYMLFGNRYKKRWNKEKSYWKLIDVQFIYTYLAYTYISSYFFYWIIRFTPEFDFTYFYGRDVCVFNSSCVSQLSAYGILSIPIAWTSQILLPDLSVSGNSLNKLLLGLFVMFGYLIIGTFWKTRVMAAMFLTHVQEVRYQTLVTNFRNHYSRLKIHPDLLVRLDRYLTCHWKFHKGKDILHPDIMRNESQEVYWNLQGSAAEKIIGESRAFRGANPELIKELACKSRFIIHPANSIMIMFGVQIENVTWLARGIVKCEYLNEKGETIKRFIYDKLLFSMNSVFMDQASLRTYTAATDCEILYISRQDFIRIFKKYHVEWSYLQNVFKEMGPFFDKLFVKYLKKHKNYQKSLRQRLFHGRQSVAMIETLSSRRFKIPIPKFIAEFRSNPESKLMLSWLVFRVITVIVSIAVTQFQTEFAVLFSQSLAINLRYSVELFGVLDILIKLFVPYYDERGLVITYIPKCAMHYLSRGFVLDVLGTVVALENFVTPFFNKNTRGSLRIILAVFKYSHLYLVVGFFDYVSDVPSNYSLYLKMLKWNILMIISTTALAAYFVSICIDFHTDVNANMTTSIQMVLMNETCWLPYYFQIDEHPTVKQLKLVMAESILLARCALYNTFIGNFFVRRYKLFITILSMMGHILYWYQMIYCMTLLMLYRFCNSDFTTDVGKMKIFLKSERVHKHIIQRAVDYLAYSWERTKGQKGTDLLNDRIGVVFRQDLTYYFYKKTFELANMLLQGSESLKRMLASCSTIHYYLPNEDIVREMDLIPYIYFIHRGKAVVIKDNERLTVLTKGSIFGPLTCRTSAACRPVHITVRTLEQADLLRVPLKSFQHCITDKIRRNISANPQSDLDYLGVQKVVPESPYNSLQYLLRGKKILKLPWMHNSVTTETSVWFLRWLFVTWVANPVMTSAIVLLTYNLPRRDLNISIYLMFVLDFLHVICIITEFYTMEIVVVKNECIKRYVRLRHFTKIWIYIDLLSVIIPIAATYNIALHFGLARLLRIQNVYFFNKEMGTALKTRMLVLIVRIIAILLLIHALTCLWMIFSCHLRNRRRYEDIPADIELDPTEWLHPNARRRGCLRLTKTSNLTHKEYFVTGQNWRSDYIIAFTYIIIIQTHTGEDILYSMTTPEIIYNILASYVLSLLEIWIGGTAISAMYNKFRERYHFDFKVLCLNKYLKDCGINVLIQKMVRNYSRMLYEKVGGNWALELPSEIPRCLRQDIMSCLYMHHFMNNILFKKLPPYFLRQLAVRLKRRIIFPGKIIVQEGDIYPCIFFIHEGEVEKWYTDKNGENRLMSVLFINEHFGLIPGVYPNVPYSYSYYSRTVVDLIFLRLNNWQDLLNGFPEITMEFYNAARKIRQS